MQSNHESVLKIVDELRKRGAIRVTFAVSPVWEEPASTSVTFGTLLSDLSHEILVSSED